MSSWVTRGIKLLAIGLVLAAIAGCGQVAKNTGGGDGDESDNPYKGNATLSGTVLASSTDVSKVRDVNPLNSYTTSAVDTVKTEAVRMEILATMKPYLIAGIENPTVINNGTAKLYVLNGDGTRTFTGITANVTNSAYTFSGVKDGVQYIVEIEKIGYDSNGKMNRLSLSAPAYIPEGTPSADVQVSSKTKYAVAMIVEKVVKKAQAASLSADIIQTIVEVVADTITELISSGQLIIPSQVEEYTPPTENVQEDTPQEITYNDQDKQLLEAIANDDEVLSLEQEASTAARLSKAPADMTVAELKVFFQNLMGEDMPDMFLTAYAEAYKQGITSTIEEMVNAMYATLVPGAQIPTATATADQVKAFLKTYTVNSITDDLTSLYNYYDNTQNTRNIAVYFEGMTQEELLEEMPMIKAIFPSTGRITLPVTATTEFNVPQGIMIFLDMIPMEKGDDEEEGMPDCALFAMYANFGVTPNEEAFQQGPPFHPVQFMEQLGWMEYDTSKAYIMHQQVQTETMWLPDNFFQTYQDYAAGSREYLPGSWVPVEILEVEVDLLAPSGTITAEITYPGPTGNVTRQLVSREVLGEGGGGSGFVGFCLSGWSIFEHWRQAEAAETTYIDRLITDFGAGTATIRIKNSGVVIASENVTVLKPNLGMVEFVYPAGPDMEQVELNNGWDPNFEPSFLDVDVTGYANPLFQWNPPAGTVPQGYTLAYRLELRESVNKMSWEQPWNPPAGFYRWEGDQQVQITSSDDWGNKELWNSWDRRRLIYTNSFQSPVPLQATTRNIANNYQSRYELNVTPVLLEQGSDRKVWEGQGTRTEFFVGNFDWSIALRGSISFPPRDVMDMITPLQQINGAWKIALFRTGSMDPVDYEWIDHWNNGSDLNPRKPVTGSVCTLGTLDQISVSGNVNMADYTMSVIKKSSNLLQKHSNYQLVIWCDANGDGMVGVTGNQNQEEGWIWFDEIQFGFEMNINCNPGRVEFWQRRYDGTERWGDLLDPANQRFDFDFANRVNSWYNFDNTYETNFGGGDWMGEPDNAMFWKDPAEGIALVQSFIGQSLPVNLDQSNYAALIRQCDQKIVSFVPASIALLPTDDPNRYHVSMNAFSQAWNGSYGLTDHSLLELPADAYHLWIYSDISLSSGTIDETALKAVNPLIHTSAPWIDDWFMSVDEGMNYTFPTNNTTYYDGEVVSGSWQVTENVIMVQLESGLPVDITRIGLANVNPSFSVSAQWDVSFSQGITTIVIAMDSSPNVGYLPNNWNDGSYFVVGYPANTDDSTPAFIAVMGAAEQPTTNPYEMPDIFFGYDPSANIMMIAVDETEFTSIPVTDWTFVIAEYVGDHYSPFAEFNAVNRLQTTDTQNGYRMLYYHDGNEIQGDFLAVEDAIASYPDSLMILGYKTSVVNYGSLPTPDYIGPLATQD